MISPIFIHSYNKYLLSTYRGPGTVLGAGDTLLNQTDKNLCPPGAHIPAGRQTTNTVAKCYSTHLRR